MVVDLLRSAMADKRVSGWFAVDGLSTISDLIHKVIKRDEQEWQLRVVAIQLGLSPPSCVANEIDCEYIFYAAD